MTRHTHDEGQLIEGRVDHDYVVHHPDGEPGLLVVRRVPALVCAACDEHWFETWSDPRCPASCRRTSPVLARSGLSSGWRQTPPERIDLVRSGTRG